MERFPPFMGEIYVARKAIKGAGLQKMRTSKDVLDLSIQAAKQLHDSSAHDPSIFGVVIEAMHYAISHKVVCITKDLAESIVNTNMNEICLDNLRLPFHLFELCVERGTRLPNVIGDVPSLLVLVGPDEATTNTIMKLLDRAGMVIDGGIDHVSNAFRMMYGQPPEKYQSNVDLRETKGKTIDDVINELPAFKVGHSLNDAEKKQSASLMRLIMGTLCYLNVREPDLRTFKDKQRMQLGEKPSCILLGDKFKPSPSWYLRRAHFRILRDERYRRDDEGKPRVVWIRETEVAAEDKNENRH